MVKNEIFDTRPSLLNIELNAKKNIILYEKFWIVTCVNRINPNKRTRYLLFHELANREFLKDETFISIVQPHFNNQIFQIYVDDTSDMVYLNMNSNIESLDFLQFKNWILKKTNCKYKFSSAKTTQKGFSQFFRLRMGLNYSLTDIDFILIKNKNEIYLIEEKTYIQNNNGYLGFGQYLGFQEVYKDILIRGKNLKFIIVFITEEQIVYLYDITSKGIPFRQAEFLSKWGKMVPIPIKEMDKMSLKELISKISD